MTQKNIRVEDSLCVIIIIIITNNNPNIIVLFKNNRFIFYISLLFYEIIKNEIKFAKFLLFSRLCP